jgi:hypothetical protein
MDENDSSEAYSLGSQAHPGRFDSVYLARCCMSEYWSPPLYLGLLVRPETGLVVNLPHRFRTLGLHWLFAESTLKLRRPQNPQ